MRKAGAEQRRAATSPKHSVATTPEFRTFSGFGTQHHRENHLHVKREIGKTASAEHA